MKAVISVPEKGRDIPVGDTSTNILNVGDNITALTNTTVVIKCPVSGVPKPKITWLRDGQEIISGEKYTIDESGTLSMSSLEKGDGGRFTCHARNRFGEDSRTTKTNIVGKFANKNIGIGNNM